MSSQSRESSRYSHELWVATVVVIVTTMLIHPKHAEDKSQVRMGSLPHSCVAQLIPKSRIRVANLWSKSLRHDSTRASTRHVCRNLINDIDIRESSDNSPKRGFRPSAFRPVTQRYHKVQACDPAGYCPVSIHLLISITGDIETFLGNVSLRFIVCPYAGQARAPVVKDNPMLDANLRQTTVHFRATGPACY